MPLFSSNRLFSGLCVAFALLGVGSAAAQNGDNYAYDRDESYRGGQDDYGQGRDSYRTSRRDDSYRPPADSYDRAPADVDRRGDSFSGRGGDAYSPPPRGYEEPGYPEPQGPSSGPSRHYEQNEIVAAGHSFFGAVSKGLASAVEYAFKNQGRPNGYILGEDASGAFVVGLRYGEGKLFTKDAGVHKVYWQGPSLGYDAGAEGSKTMVLVYNMYDPGDLYHRFAGAEGSAYLVGGVSVQFQTHGRVTLAVIRSGVGVRLGANVGYSKYSRSPTWNPL
jgi:hypothetical protein